MPCAALRMQNACAGGYLGQDRVLGYVPDDGRHF